MLETLWPILSSWKKALETMTRNIDLLFIFLQDTTTVASK